MGRRLNSTVHVLADDGAYHVFGPEGDVPPELAAKIGDHAWNVDEGSDEGAAAPAKSAAKPEWVDFAVAQGADRADAEAMTKEELTNRYSGS